MEKFGKAMPVSAVPLLTALLQRQEVYACFTDFQKAYYALINRARGPYEEIFVLTFKAYGPNAVRFMRLECQNKYFPYGPKSLLIRALLYTYPNKTVQDETLLK